MNRAVLVAAAFAAAAFGADSVHVVLHAQGRNIQHDGFLLEWADASAKRFPGGDGLTWDAVNTPAGLAGYLRTPSADSCTPRCFTLVVSPQRRYDACFDSADGGQGTWKLFAADDGTSHAEFLVPWEQAALDSAGVYDVSIDADNPCGTQRGVLRLSGGRYFDVTGRVWSRRVQVQTVVIGVLLASYLLLTGSVRRKNRRTESPRRSA